MLSVIIPTLNEAVNLPPLLADLSRQIYQDFEVIVVDGHSDDKTVTEAKKFASLLPRLRIVNSRRRHVCVQRNIGARLAKGEILVFADADCRIGQEFLLGLRYRWETAGVDVLSFWFKADVKSRENEAVALAVNLFRELQDSLHPRYLLEALFAVNKRAFGAVGGFDETVDYAEGTELIKDLWRKGYRSKTVRDPVYIFSFRRLRQLGLLKMAGTMARLELSKLIGKDYRNILGKRLYPMDGGRQFVYNRRTKNRFMTKISQLLEKL